MKSEHKQPWMLAYIIFLIISIIYYCFSKAVSFSFEAWENIIAAATIASYFFTLASGELFVNRINRLNIEYLNKSIRYIEEIEKEKTEIGDLDFVALAKNEKKEIEKEIIEQVNNINKTKKSSFIYQVIGYLCFFGVMSFAPFSQFVKMNQDVCTLAAFAMLMIMEYVEATRMRDFEEHLKDYPKSKEENLVLLNIKNTNEVKNNGREA